MKTVILAAIAALAFTTAASAEDGVFYGNVKDKWQIHAYRGNPAYCMASGFFAQSGSTLGILLDTHHQATVALASSKIKDGLINGNEYVFNVFMNGQFYQTAKTTVKDGVIAFTLTGAGLDDLMTANSVGLETGVYTIGTYSLKYSAVAVLKLQECAAVLRSGQQQLTEQPKPNVEEPEQQSSYSM
jgi:hypothetical protein